MWRRAAGSLESFHFQKRIYPHFPSLSVGEREEKIETHTVMCLCDKKRRAQAESQGGEKKSKKAENKTKKMSEESSRKRKSYPQCQAVVRMSFFHLIRVSEEGQCVYGPVGLVRVRGSWADRESEDGREGGGGKASTGTLHPGQGQVNEGVGPGAK